MFSDLLVPVPSPVFDIATLLRDEAESLFDLFLDCDCPDNDGDRTFCVLCCTRNRLVTSLRATARTYDAMSLCELNVHTLNCQDYDPDPEPTPLPDGSRDGYDDLARDVFNIWEPDWMLSERINFRKHLLNQEEQARQEDE